MADDQVRYKKIAILLGSILLFGLFFYCVYLLKKLSIGLLNLFPEEETCDNF